MTNIEWVKNPDGTQGNTVNSKTGCLNHAPEGLCLNGLFPCYAYKLANGRLKPVYLNNLNVCEFESRYHEIVAQDQLPFYPRWWPERLDKIRGLKKPIGIFLDDMSDWMGNYWPEEWTRQEIQVMKDCPQHRFYTLTKQPQNLIKFSPFPENCWVGVTACNRDMYLEAWRCLNNIGAAVKFVSLEPLLGRILDSDFGGLSQRAFGEDMVRADIKWLITGACTGTWYDIFQLSLRYPGLTMVRLNKRLYTLQPRIEDLREIVEATDKAGVKVFLKDNLKPLFEIGKPYPWATNTLGFLRQEFPKCQH